MDAPTLTWNSHINMIKAECNARLNIMRALSGTSWGAGRDTLLKIYVTMIRSKLSYGSQALLSACPTNLKKLEIIQNAALRIATGAWRNTTIEALQVEANILPLEIYLETQNLKYYFKLKSLGITHPVSSQIFNDERTENKIWTPSVYKKPFALRSEELIRTWNLSEINIPQINSGQIIPPWLNIKDNVHVDLDTFTTKAMGKTQNKLSHTEYVAD